VEINITPRPGAEHLTRLFASWQAAKKAGDTTSYNDWLARHGVDRFALNGISRPAPEPEPRPEAEPFYSFTAGGSFILDTDPDPVPLWGSGSQVLMADGEALIIAGGQGLGKQLSASNLPSAGAASPSTRLSSASRSTSATR
jgi:hypothetical protein